MIGACQWHEGLYSEWLWSPVTQENTQEWRDNLSLCQHGRLPRQTTRHFGVIRQKR